MARTLGKIYGSAPTNVATDNFAERLDRISQKITSRLNAKKRSKDSARARRTFIIRGYSREDEYEVFINTLKDPGIGNKAAPNNGWRPDSSWNLHLSPSFWLLIALRCTRAVREIHEDDPIGLFNVQKSLDSLVEYRRLRQVATNAISWQQYESGPMVEKADIEKLFYRLLQSADILCTTPAISCQRPYRAWKEELAQGIAIDEAGNISRPDLYSVWGNTLSPLAMAGDDKQLPPPVMSHNERDSDGNYHNRLGNDGRVSALEFFRGSGWPIYRLRTQFRMAEGLFDTCHHEVYPDLPFQYSTGSALINHPAGRALEQYLLDTYKGLRRSPPDPLQRYFSTVQAQSALWTR